MLLDCAVADTKFWAYWKNKEYTKAISVYNNAGKPFWLAETVGRYYERNGQLKKSIEEYEHLIDEYLKIRKNFLPLPKGPEELFKLGKWYVDKSKVKTRKYLELYLSAEDKYKIDPAFYLSHKDEAKEILNRLRK